MKWTLIRTQYREDGIFGTLTSEDGLHTFVTLEHAYKIEDEHYPKEVSYYPKIQEGIHPCVQYKSPRHGYIVPLLDGPDDKGHEYELHIGNFNVDSIGCILIGVAIVEHMVTHSTQAFEEIMKLGVTEIEVASAL